MIHRRSRPTSPNASWLVVGLAELVLYGNLSICVNGTRLSRLVSLLLPFLYLRDPICSCLSQSEDCKTCFHIAVNDCASWNNYSGRRGLPVSRLESCRCSCNTVYYVGGDGSSMMPLS